MLSPLKQPHSEPPIQIVEADLSNGMHISAPVDLWIATLLEVVDQDLRQVWLETIIKKIQDQQVQPKLFVPDRGVVQ